MSNEYIDRLNQKLAQQQNTQKVLIAQKVVHEGAMHGWASNGLTMLDLGNGYGLQIIASAPTATKQSWRTIQLFRYAIDTQPKSQTWTRTKTKFIQRQPIEDTSIPITDQEVLF